MIQDSKNIEYYLFHIRIYVKLLTIVSLGEIDYKMLLLRSRYCLQLFMSKTPPTSHLRTEAHCRHAVTRLMTSQVSR